jgi:hypothetical protein
MDLINMAERALAGITDLQIKAAEKLARLRNLRSSFNSLGVVQTGRGEQVLARIDQEIKTLEPPKFRNVSKPRFPIFGKPHG